MRRPNRIAQAYGFTVCLLSLVAVASALTTIADAAFKLSDPLLAGSRTQRMSWLSSDALIEGAYGTLTFGQYRLNRLRELHMMSGAPARDLATLPILQRQLQAAAAERAALPSDDELRREYHALRAETAALRRFHAARLLVTNLALLAVALVVFAAHWRWVNRLVLVDLGAGPLRAP